MNSCKQRTIVRIKVAAVAVIVTLIPLRIKM